MGIYLLLGANAKHILFLEVCALRVKSLEHWNATLIQTCARVGSSAVIKRALTKTNIEYIVCNMFNFRLICRVLVMEQKFRGSSCPPCVLLMALEINVLEAKKTKLN